MKKVPVSEMVLVWSYDDQRRITGSRIRSKGRDTPETEVYPSSSGACVSDWLDGSSIETPLGLFAKLSTIYGFASQDLLEEMLQEFSCVEGQDWAGRLSWELAGRPEEHFGRPV